MTDIAMEVGAWPGSTDIARIGFNPVIGPEQRVAFLKDIRLYDIHPLLGAVMLDADHPHGRPHTEIDCEKLSKLMEEARLTLTPLNIARHMRDILIERGDKATLDEEIKELPPAQPLLARSGA